MIGQIFVSLALLAVAAAAEIRSEVPFKSLEGVDPNTLSCDPLGQIFLLLPHFKDCAKFYMCAHGQEVEFSCAPGTIFDFELQTCNHPWATECVLRTEPDEEGSGFDSDDGVMSFGLFGEEEENGPAAILSGDSSGTVRPLSSLQAQLFKGALNCNQPTAAARQIAYKGDCQRFWRCSSGVPQAVYCSDGLFFNEDKQQCDFEANVKCSNSNTSDAEAELNGEFLVYNK